MKWSKSVKLLSLVVCLVLIVAGTALAKNNHIGKIEIPTLDIQLPSPDTGGQTTSEAVYEEPTIEAAAEAVNDPPGVVVAQAVYNDLQDVSLTATSLVPGEEARYIITFSADENLALDGAVLSVAFPESFGIIQNDSLDEDPGCTLASLQYKNKDSEKYWTVLQGDTEVATENGLTTFSMEISKSATINAGRKVYVILPGVVNAAEEGTYPVQLQLQCSSGADTHGAQAECTLGAPPADAPENLYVEAASSYLLQASWDAVDGASRYQLYFSLDPNGYFIQACDNGSEPPPGKLWDLTQTSCEFTAKGNGYLEAGRNYYFKVRAGNEFGYGPLSDVFTVETPVLILDAPPMVGRSPIKVGVSEDVEIVDPDRIMIFEAATGTPVANQVSADGDTITITSDALKTGTRYQAVFFKDALKSTGEIETFNNLFGFEFVAINKGLK